ncbi:hypothetical protein [Rhizobium leguminosarum]|uniref:hypothetical protein n=1 Tax=Rhizobium leguminosarum TaxID=384 RepID=UPI001D1E3670|nr:hypothetical protein [Rhizobium leguminosarum]MBP2449764.1 hypothetical protein [Rhizobium leguminosarum]
MTKPQILTEYSADVTRDCERVLVTLFSGLGPWRDSVFLVGGLARHCNVNRASSKMWDLAA